MHACRRLQVLLGWVAVLQHIQSQILFGSAKLVSACALFVIFHGQLCFHRELFKQLGGRRCDVLQQLSAALRLVSCDLHVLTWGRLCMPYKFRL